MAHCPRCGSHRIRRSLHPLTLLVRSLSGRRRFHCSRCGWHAWLTRDFFLADSASSPATSRSSRRRRLRSSDASGAADAAIALEGIDLEPRDTGDAARNPGGEPPGPPRAAVPLEDVDRAMAIGPAAIDDEQAATSHTHRRHDHHRHGHAPNRARRRRRAGAEVIRASMIALAVVALLWVGGKACRMIAPPPDTSAPIGGG